LSAEADVVSRPDRGVAGIENSGHAGLFSVLPSIVMTGAHARKTPYPQFRASTGATGILGTVEFESTMCAIPGETALFPVFCVYCRPIYESRISDELSNLLGERGRGVWFLKETTNSCG